MDRIKTLEEGKQLLAEYEALPDLDARLNWSGYARLPEFSFTCVCGHSYACLMSIDDLRRTIEKGWEWKLVYHKDTCWGHDDGEDEDEDDDQEEG